jgi:hypothetical protein
MAATASPSGNLVAGSSSPLLTDFAQDRDGTPARHGGHPVDAGMSRSVTSDDLLHAGT